MRTIITVSSFKSDYQICVSAAQMQRVDRHTSGRAHSDTLTRAKRLSTQPHHVSCALLGSAALKMNANLHKYIQTRVRQRMHIISHMVAFHVFLFVPHGKWHLLFLHVKMCWQTRCNYSVCLMHSGSIQGNGHWAEEKALTLLFGHVHKGPRCRRSAFIITNLSMATSGCFPF